MKNLVLGTALGYGIYELKNFVLSFREHNKVDDVILLVDLRLSPDAKTFLEKHNIQTRMFMSSNFIPTHINNSRFVKYADILLDEEENYKNVFLTDTRDIIFQADPFENLPDAFLYFFSEESKIKIKDEPYNSQWLKSLYGDQMFSTLESFNIVCAGTTLGSMMNIKKYVLTMWRMLVEVGQKNPNLYRSNIDQGLHNFLAYKSGGEFDNFQIKETGDLVGTIGLTLTYSPEDITTDEDGNILVKNKIMPIIHQYDRSKPISEMIEKKYEI